MTERGTYCLDRGLFGHPRFAPEPFTEREAWSWMIGQAAFRPHCHRVGNFRIMLKRGQFAHSIRWMAETWQWSPTTVRRFLDKLSVEIEGDGAMIGTATDNGITVVTICNYNKFQPVAASEFTENGAPNGAEVAQQRHKEEAFAEGSSSSVDARAREAESDVPGDADLELARSFLAAIGTDSDGPLLSSVAYTAVVWRQRKYDRAAILATGAELAARGESFPLSYYFAAIVRRHDERARDGPGSAVASIPPATHSSPRQFHAKPSARSPITTAIDRHIERFEREGSEEIGGGEIRQAPPRLLSHG